MSATGHIPPSDRAYRTMRAVEDAHWWFDGMEAITAALLDTVSLRPAVEILDAGCGTGRNMSFLTRRFGHHATVTGLDFSSVALAHCRARGFARLIHGSVNALPFADASFDLVTSFDVVTAGSVDDRAAFAEMARVLRPGGRLLVRVAAYDFLRSRHDREWHITRRYMHTGLRARVNAAGLLVRVISYANTWLFPVALVKRLAETFLPPREENSDLEIGVGPGIVSRSLRALLTSERRWAAAGLLPFGLSLYALAEK